MTGTLELGCSGGAQGKGQRLQRGNFQLNQVRDNRPAGSCSFTRDPGLHPQRSANLSGAGPWAPAAAARPAVTGGRTGAQWLPQCCGSLSTLVPGICRDLAPSLAHHLQLPNLRCLMYHPQVACVLSSVGMRSTRLDSPIRWVMAPATYREQPGERRQSRHWALLGFPETSRSRACNE